MPIVDSPGLWLIITFTDVQNIVYEISNIYMSNYSYGIASSRKCYGQTGGRRAGRNRYAPSSMLCVGMWGWGLEIAFLRGSIPFMPNAHSENFYQCADEQACRSLCLLHLHFMRVVQNLSWYTVLVHLGMESILFYKHNLGTVLPIIIKVCIKSVKN